MLEFIQSKAKATVLSAASVIVMMQLFIPAMFDFFFDLILLGLLFIGMQLDNRSKK